MKHRKFITLLGGAAAVRPLAAWAQQPKPATIGVLVHAAPGWQHFWQVFPEALRELGYMEGKNIRFEFRSDQGEMSRLPELAGEVVRLKVNVLCRGSRRQQLPQSKRRTNSQSSVRSAETWSEPDWSSKGWANVGREFVRHAVALARDSGCNLAN
jgi:hypothetical protein